MKKKALFEKKNGNLELLVERKNIKKTILMDMAKKRFSTFLYEYSSKNNFFANILNSGCITAQKHRKPDFLLIYLFQMLRSNLELLYYKTSISYKDVVLHSILAPKNFGQTHLPLKFPG